jgi:hypothetical protein
VSTRVIGLTDRLGRALFEEAMRGDDAGKKFKTPVRLSSEEEKSLSESEIRRRKRLEGRAAHL